MCLLCISVEGKFGKDGKDKNQADMSQPNTLYTTDEHAYNFDLNLTLSLEDWAHFSRSVDHTYTFLSPCLHDLLGGPKGGGSTLVSSANKAVSLIYFMTLATLVVLLNEAGVNVLGFTDLHAHPSPSAFQPSSSHDLTKLISITLENQETWMKLPNDLLKSGWTEWEEREEEEYEEP